MKKQMCLVLALLLVFCSLPISAAASEMSYKVVISPQYEEVGRFNDGYAPVKIDGKWGYIDESNELVVEAKYDWAGEVSEGVAVTLILGDCEDERGEPARGYYAHLVDMDGMDKPLYWREGEYFWDGLHTYPLIIGEFFDETFWSYPNCEASSFFANASRWYCNGGIVNVGGVSFTATGERVRVQNQAEYGMGYCDFNQTGPAVNGIIPIQVTEIPTPMCDAMQIDQDGNVLFYSSEYASISAPWEGMQMALKRIVIESDDSWEWEEQYLWGLMDTDNNWLAEPQFINYMYTSDGALFHDGLMPVRLETEKWGAINTSGKLMIDAQYDGMTCFSNGFSCVFQDGNVFFIDTDGNPYTILDLNGEPANVTLSSKVSTKGLAAVYDESTNKAYYVNLLAAHDGVVPAVPGSDCLGLESYIDAFSEDGTPESIAIPSEFVPIKQGDLWGFVEWTFDSTANPFRDVPLDSFYEAPVLWAVENGITNGLSETEFGPNADCNRAQVVTFLWRAAGCPEPTTTENPFEDVAEGSFYEKPVLWAVENGITNGADATHFNPNGVCNRAQVVTFLYRAFESPEVSTEGMPFTDVPADQWFAAPVLWAVENGITNGLTATEFGPNTPCNRAQVVTFLYRAYTD